MICPLKIYVPHGSMRYVGVISFVISLSIRPYKECNFEGNLLVSILALKMRKFYTTASSWGGREERKRRKHNQMIVLTVYVFSQTE